MPECRIAYTRVELLVFVVFAEVVSLAPSDSSKLKGVDP
jgi:hypothetical protein